MIHDLEILEGGVRLVLELLYMYRAGLVHLILRRYEGTSDFSASYRIDTVH